MTWRVLCPASGAPHDVLSYSRSRTGTRNIFFIIFVDEIFTTFIARPFTKTFHALKRMCAISCVMHAGHAD